MAAFLLLALVGLAAGEGGEITLPAEDNVVLLTLNLERDERVDFSWSATASVTFEVENLAGTRHLSREGQMGSGTFVVPATGTYVFALDNDNPFVVTSEWTVEKQQPLPILLIGVVVGVVLALALLVFLWLRRRPRSPS